MDNQQLYNDFTNFINLLKINSTFERTDISMSEDVKILDEEHVVKTENAKDDKTHITKKTRCALCKVKISAVDTIISSCKCEKNYCLKHRMPESHKCEKLEQIVKTQKDNLESSLVKLVSDKMVRL